MLKPLSICLLLLMSINSFAQQVDLSGQISIHNSKYESKTKTIRYVADAQVTAPYGGADISDVKGRFDLAFVGIEKGNSITIDVDKYGLKVVNQKDLIDVVLGRTTLLRIYMAEPKKLAQVQTEFYEISEQALLAEVNRKIAILEKEGEEKDQLIVQLKKDFRLEYLGKNEAIYKLQEQLEEAKKKLPAFAKELAYVNLDFASDLYIEAYELFKAGKIKEALEVLDEAQLEKAARDGLATISIGEQAIEKGRETVQQVIDSYQLKADGYNLLFEYRNAAAVYEKAILLLEEIKEEEDLELADAYREIGSIYQDLGVYQKALEYYLKNVSICEDLLAENDSTLAMSYNNLALIYKDLGDYEKALTAQQEALNIFEYVLEPNHPSIATSYNNLAGIYQDLGDYDKALIAQLKALEIKEQVLEPNHLS
ncbi:MAG: tetratricopeptide repeat protein, partial [Bacteroidota bacterium]